MPGKPRPFIAAKAFSCASIRYAKGDVVDNPVVLAAVRVFGDEFISASPAPKSPTTNKEA